MDQKKLQECLDKNPFAKLGDVVADLLFDEIVSLTLAPYTKLNINNISKELGISRTPVTEAINQLCAIGFVEVRPNASGYYVSGLSMEELINLYNARAAIESEAAYLCAETAGYDVIAGLENMASEFKRAFQRRDSRALKEVEMPFHRLIIDSCGNPYIRKSYELLLPKLTMYQSSMLEFIGRSNNENNPWMSSVKFNHLSVVSAIRMRMPLLARQSMADHVDASMNFTTLSGNGADPFLFLRARHETD